MAYSVANFGALRFAAPLRIGANFFKHRKLLQRFADELVVSDQT